MKMMMMGNNTKQNAVSSVAAVAAIAALLAVLAAATTTAAATAGDVGVFTPKITKPEAPTLMRSWKGENGNHAGLYSVAASGYDKPFLFLNVSTADHYNAGFGWAYLIPNETLGTYNALLNHLLPNKELQIVLAAFLDSQYLILERHLPSAFADEMRGIKDGAAAVGVPEAYHCSTRAVAIASIAVGDVEKDIMYLLKNELEPSVAAAVNALENAGYTSEDIAREIANSRLLRLGRTCSMFGAWGSRTVGGDLFTGRNLDWSAQTGVAEYKLVSVYHIQEMIPYASVSFAGLPGAITGISAAGVTVHEAGDDSKNVTMKGFSWLLRLRALMETVRTQDDAIAFWKNTKNTMGINHGVGTVADKSFLALETHAGYTAYFHANDPREANYEVDGVHYGFPLEEALWRTNHAYDPTFISESFQTKPGTDTFNRYMLLHNTFVDYKAGGVLIDDLQAVNLTAVVGDKGGDSVPSFTSCANAVGGENIISATFKPSVDGDAIMYLAFENGYNATHVPACCNNYVKFNMAEWFGV